MNRRAFFARLLPVAAAVPVVSGGPSLRPPQPYTRHIAHCPTCGDMMMITTRRHEMRSHDDPYVWICARCRRAWNVPAQAFPAQEVAYPL